jgi:2-polyprenyl-3-methyl-5-hydroxy-6-metoxy-1,4-benzoquinol methylase
MKLSLLEIISCPHCGGKFSLKNEVKNRGEIESGTLNCKESHSFPIFRYVPRFVEKKNYSESWGELWNETGAILKDSFTGIPFHHNIIYGKYDESNKGLADTSPFGFSWPRKMEGQRILEIGPGTGNLTENLVSSKAEVFSVDMSHAIDVFPEELLTQPNLHVIQADLFSNILPTEFFDKIWMFQVLQHTPKPFETLKRLKSFLKIGGEIAFTSYKNDKQYRPLYYRILRNLDPKLNWKILSKVVPPLLPVKYQIQKSLCKVGLPKLARIAAKVMEPIDPRNIYYSTLEGQLEDYSYAKYFRKTKDLDYLKKIALINTYDRITPTHTNSADWATVEKWCADAGYKEIKTWGKGGVRATAKR